MPSAGRPQAVVDTIALSLRGEGIKGCVAKHPKEKHEAKQDPDVRGRECVPSNRLSAEYPVCVFQQRVQEERQPEN